MRILLDCDGVLCDSLPTWVHEYNCFADGADRLHTSDIKSYNFEQFAKFPELLFDTLHLGDVFRRSPPMPNAIQALKFLNAHHEVFVVTYMHKSCVNGHRQRLDWFQHYMPFLDTDRVIFTRNKAVVQGDILVEDNPANLGAWLEAHPSGRGFLIDHLYNRNSKVGERAYGLMDVVEAIGKVAA